MKSEKTEEVSVLDPYMEELTFVRRILSFVIEKNMV